MTNQFLVPPLPTRLLSQSRHQQKDKEALSETTTTTSVRKVIMSEQVTDSRDDGRKEELHVTDDNTKNNCMNQENDGRRDSSCNIHQKEQLKRKDQNDLLRHQYHGCDHAFVIPETNRSELSLSGGRTTASPSFTSVSLKTNKETVTSRDHLLFNPLVSQEKQDKDKMLERRCDKERGNLDYKKKFSESLCPESEFTKTSSQENKKMEDNSGCGKGFKEEELSPKTDERMPNDDDEGSRLARDSRNNNRSLSDSSNPIGQKEIQEEEQQQKKIEDLGEVERMKEPRENETSLLLVSADDVPRTDTCIPCILVTSETSTPENSSLSQPSSQAKRQGLGRELSSFSSDSESPRLKIMVENERKTKSEREEQVKGTSFEDKNVGKIRLSLLSETEASMIEDIKLASDELTSRSLSFVHKKNKVMTATSLLYYGIKRIIFACKFFKPFQALPERDQRFLLKNACSEMLLLRSVFHANLITDSWEFNPNSETSAPTSCSTSSRVSSSSSAHFTSSSSASLNSSSYQV